MLKSAVSLFSDDVAIHFTDVSLALKQACKASLNSRDRVGSTVNLPKFSAGPLFHQHQVTGDLLVEGV